MATPVRWKLKNRAASENEGGLGQGAFTASGQWRCCECRHGIQAPGRFPLARQVPSSGSARLGQESGWWHCDGLADTERSFLSYTPAPAFPQALTAPGRACWETDHQTDCWLTCWATPQTQRGIGRRHRNQQGNNPPPPVSIFPIMQL